MARSGYTLPVFAVAAAKAALQKLLQTSMDPQPISVVTVDILGDVGDRPEIDIEQLAQLDSNSALAVTRSDPGDNLDITRQTPIWAWVSWGDRIDVAGPEGPAPDSLILQAGEGLGRREDGSAAIYSYAHQLFRANLGPLLPSDRQVIVRIILPEGRRLAERTSNAAFGVLDGLALLGTHGIAQPLSAQDYLEAARTHLRQSVERAEDPVLCIGSHGRQVAQSLGFSPEQIVQAANWIGPLLVEAGLAGARSLHLVGYHGKLLKLAGGIFNTSSHVADGRLEILTASLIQVGGNVDLSRRILAMRTVEQAQAILVSHGWAETVFQDLACKVQQRARAYISKYAERDLAVTVVLFDRQGQIWGRCGD